MKNLLCYCIIFLLHTPLITCGTITLSPKQITNLGHIIWQRECNRSSARLTYWNSNEKFPSLGIGHFIWYPAGHKDKKYTQTFPALLSYLQKRGIELPAWLAQSKTTGCPWPNKTAFDAAQETEQMKQLRNLLCKTIDIQANFIVDQCNNLLKDLISHLPSHRKKKYIQTAVSTLTCHVQGAFALIDYCHFKGIGTRRTERYNKQGWGLLQVLETMQLVPQEKPTLVSFVQSAKKILIQRVHNSPSEHNESRWLPGWLARVDSYLNS